MRCSTRCGSLRRAMRRAGARPRSEPIDIKAAGSGLRVAALSRARGFFGGARARGLRRTAHGSRGYALAFAARLGQTDRNRLLATLDFSAFAALAALERAALELAHLAFHVLRSAACVSPRHGKPPP